MPPSGQTPPTGPIGSARMTLPVSGYSRQLRLRGGIGSDERFLPGQAVLPGPGLPASARLHAPAGGPGALLSDWDDADLRSLYPVADQYRATGVSVSGDKAAPLSTPGPRLRPP